jgi:hypothetical protein
LPARGVPCRAKYRALWRRKTRRNHALVKI